MLGGPVFGKEFFDRETLLADLIKNIPHAHHALTGPRGCGKSSILKQLAVSENTNEFVPVYIDVARIVPRTQQAVIRKIGRETLYAAMRKKGLIQKMPTLVRDKAGKVADFVRDNLRVKIGDWITLYFDQDAELTELIEQTFSSIESYGTELLIMLDEITSIIRMTGTQPNEEDMNFMEALRGHLSEAKHAHYIFCGSQLGLMNLIIKMKFGRMLVSKEVGGLDDDGATELLRKKIKRAVPAGYFDEVKRKTRCWPLYLQAYCLATEMHVGALKTPNDVTDEVFDLLSGHFRYLESQLGETETMVMLLLDGGKVSDLASKLNTKYATILTALRYLELKGFVERTSPGTYAALDPMFSEWLKREYEPPDEWK